MNFADYEAIAFRRDGGVLHVILNRPESMNAVDDTMDRDLARLFIDVADDPETRVVVLTGAGKAFSAGGNIELLQESIDNPEVFYNTMARSKRVIYALLDCPKPVIAKVNGHAMGLGANLALFCDIIYAVPTAKIADPHVNVGFVAGDGGAVIWPQLIGYARAKEFLLTGDPITGADAARIGLINHAVEPENIDAVVDEMAQRLAQGPARAIQWTKASVNIGLKQLAHTILDASMAYEVISNHTRDHREAVAAFRERRKPQFTGN